jgi:hypothetical protein
MFRISILVALLGFAAMPSADAQIVALGASSTAGYVGRPDCRLCWPPFGVSPRAVPGKIS